MRETTDTSPSSVREGFISFALGKFWTCPDFLAYPLSGPFQNFPEANQMNPSLSVTSKKTRKRLRLSRRAIKRKCPPGYQLPSKDENPGIRGNPVDMWNNRNHGSRFCVKLPYHLKDYVKLLFFILQEFPGKWDYALNFMMVRCDKQSKRERKASSEECFDQFKIDPDNFWFLKWKLQKKPECIVDLVDKLVD